MLVHPTGELDKNKGKTFLSMSTEKIVFSIDREKIHELYYFEIKKQGADTA